MIKLRYTYIFRLLLAMVMAFCLSPSLAQEGGEKPQKPMKITETPPQEDIIKQTDSIAVKKFLSGVELAVDYGKLLMLWTDFESKYEAGLNLRFYEQYVLAAEFGMSELNPLKAYDNTVKYTVKGSYARLGLDYYTSYNPTSFYYGGFRYGVSSFEDEGIFLLDSEYWEDYQEGFGSKDITASWVEIILGTETYLKFSKKKDEDPTSKLLLGWKFRLRFLMDFENREVLRIYSIPGYGRTFDNVVPAVNFYIKYRIGK